MRAQALARRGLLLGSSLLAALGARAAVAQQPAPPLPPLWQPPAPTPEAFLARAHALRDEAVAAGDQPFGALLVRAGLIVGEGRSGVVTRTDPTAHSELTAVRDAARRLGTRALGDCVMYSSATPCPMCQGALYWAGVPKVITASRPDGFAPRLGC